MRCPACGRAELEIVTDGAVGIPVFVASEGRAEVRLESRPFAACPRCEFCVDLAPAVAALRREGR